MEESNAWRHPVDLVRLLEHAFEELPAALERGDRNWAGRAALVERLLEDEAAPIVEALLAALREGASEVELASAVAYAAATRIARFPTSNEFGDPSVLSTRRWSSTAAAANPGGAGGCWAVATGQLNTPRARQTVMARGLMAAPPRW